MSISKKAIFAALVLSLTPALASAQTYPLTNFGPGVGGAPLPGINLGINPGAGLPGYPVHPVQGLDCGAQRYQGFVGQYVGAMHSYGINARYFTPDSPHGTMDYQPGRLNVSTDARYVIDRIYCG
jgi:hypothetical protein